jgi:D-alanyl-D-alanine carboxypeptidase
VSSAVPASCGSRAWPTSSITHAQRATGSTLAGEISRRIARPLRLAGTYLPRGADTKIRGPHSRRYSRLIQIDPNAKTYDVTELNPSPFWAAGGMISTAGDLNRFFEALLGGRLLPLAQQREMFTMIPTKDWIPDTTYGLGISSVRLSCGTTVWGHGRCHLRFVVIRLRHP